MIQGHSVEIFMFVGSGGRPIARRRPAHSSVQPKMYCSLRR